MGRRSRCLETGGCPGPSGSAAARRIGANVFTAARLSKRRKGVEGRDRAGCEKPDVLERFDDDVLFGRKLSRHPRAPGRGGEVGTADARRVVYPCTLLR